MRRTSRKELASYARAVAVSGTESDAAERIRQQHQDDAEFNRVAALAEFIIEQVKDARSTRRGTPGRTQR